MSSAEDTEEERRPEKHLRLADISAEVADGELSAATQLALVGKSLTDMDSLESMTNLKKLELQDNMISSCGFLEMNHGLAWLGLARNRLSKISCLENLESLAVLDLSENRITTMSGFGGLVSLKALILSRNRIRVVEGLSPKKNPALETLVLSHNLIDECNFGGHMALKKLSLGGNRLHKFPGLGRLPALTELRLNGNKIGSVPANIRFMPSLSLVDLGNNAFSDISGLEPLKDVRKLKNLNILGNSVASAGCDVDPVKTFAASMLSLDILNNKRRQEKAKQKGKWDSNQNGAVETIEWSKGGRKGDSKGSASVKRDWQGAEIPCRNFMKGWCSYGAWCRFLHEDEKGDTGSREACHETGDEWRKKGRNHGTSSGQAASGELVTAQGGVDDQKRRTKGKKPMSKENKNAATETDSPAVPSKRTKRKSKVLDVSGVVNSNSVAPPKKKKTSKLRSQTAAASSQAVQVRKDVAAEVTQQSSPKRKKRRVTGAIESTHSGQTAAADEATLASARDGCKVLRKKKKKAKPSS